MNHAPTSLAAVLLLMAVAAPLPAQQERAQGMRVRTLLHEDGSRTDSKIDPDARTMEEKTFDPAGKLVRFAVFNLNEANQAVSGISYTPQGRPIFKFTYQLDPMGRVAIQHNFDLENRPTTRIEYRYGPDGAFIRADTFDASGQRVRQAAENVVQPGNKRRDNTVRPAVQIRSSP